MSNEEKNLCQHKQYILTFSQFSGGHRISYMVSGSPIGWNQEACQHLVSWFEKQPSKDTEKEFPGHKKIEGMGGIWKVRRKVHFQKTGWVDCVRHAEDWRQ